ncbi:DUF4350 domain-containing protein [Microbacterium sp. A93]|uniref:DUF4350 domain-containing protein n=1 Tax=Microbacterium sp. A93 TaxID=3450716 RepID=UPI003F43C447
MSTATSTPETATPGTSTPGTATPEIPTTGRALAHWWRKAWIWFVLTALLLLVAVPSMLRQTPDDRLLSPDSASPQGALAVVRVLQDHGITVHPATSLHEAVALADEHPEASVLFHDAADHLPAAGLDELAAAVEADRRVLVEPDFAVLQHLAPSVAQAGQVPDGDRLASGDRCRLPMGREARSIPAAGRAYRAPDAEACFPVPGTGEGPSGPAHTVLQTADGTLVFGDHGIFANESADTEGHPVLSLWSLGRSADVVWYLPGLQDAAVDQGPPTTEQLLPDWVRPAGIWLIICLVVLMLWRGRRHGPLAVEPLPVVVPASEAAVGRARLYERFGHHDAAARSLRSATLVRLSRTLRLGHGASVQAVVSAVARVTGRDPSRVAADLDVAQVGTSRDLVAAGRRLQGLEEAVQAALTTDPTPPGPKTPDPDGRTP